MREHDRLSQPMTFTRYKQNLHYRLSYGSAGTSDPDPMYLVYSYNTLVAQSHKGQLLERGYWSVTTRKHVNYAAKQLGLTVNHVAN